MRLCFCLLALVASATAVPMLGTKAANVDTLTKQQDVLLLLDQLFQDIPNEQLHKFGQEYNIKQNIQQYDDQNVVKNLIRLVEMDLILPKRVPFSISFTELRSEVSLLTRTLVTAKTYETFLKTAAWARYIFNEAEFYQAFTVAIFQRTDTRDLVLPAPYEVFPYYYIDTRVIKEAQNARVRTLETGQTTTYVIPSNYTPYMTEYDRKLAYFTQDVGLASWYAYFDIAGWLKTMNETNLGFLQNYECEHCETARGSMFYYVHQQLLARYNLERLSNDMPTLRETEFTHVRVPFKSHLSYPNGLEISGRSFDCDFKSGKEDLVETVLTIERRLQDAIDSGFVVKNVGDLFSLYDYKGLNILGNIIESTGRSINPRYYGTFQAAVRELLGGAPTTKRFWDPLPSTLEIHHTTTRDPVFYQMWKRMITLFKRYKDTLPGYTPEDLRLPGVTIESVKFDKLTTYCDKFMVDIDSATIVPQGKESQRVKMMTEIDRLNHKPFKFEIMVNSEQIVEHAVIRVYIGPKYDFDGTYLNIHENRLQFIELDQFLWSLKQGKNIIVRHSIDAPMRSIDATTKKDLLRKVQEGLTSHQLFYPEAIAEAFGFPERLALPKGKRNGMPLQVMVIISSPNQSTPFYGPSLPPRFRTYQYLSYPDIDITTSTTEVPSERWVRDYRTTMMNAGGVFYSHDIDTDTMYGRTDTKNIKTEQQTSQQTAQAYYESRMDRTAKTRYPYMTDYYNKKDVKEIIGGAVSLDGRPLGYPLDRRLEMGSLYVPNIKMTETKVFWEGTRCCGSCR
ncbi:hexamerin-like [Diprion similis]|uniref:hexamerin-like n=1 Tax=Diprion similis TaxID=362088 RepID=UPI001EF77C5E|nr:hexamerin-like [Diprion similis]